MLPHICPIIKALRIIFLSGYITSWLTIKSYLLGLLDCCLLLTTERCMILFYSSSVGSLLLPVLFINSLEMFIFFSRVFRGSDPINFCLSISILFPNAKTPDTNKTHQKFPVPLPFLFPLPASYSDMPAPRLTW